MIRRSYLEASVLLLIHPGMFQLIYVHYVRTAVIFVQVQTHRASLGLGFRAVLASAVAGEGGTNIPSAYIGYIK